ncbi:MAG: cation-translocating P-type ATPase, partial [Bacteroidaceae bacterium]
EDMNVDILKQELTKYQNEAMRTLGFAYCEVLDPKDSIETCLQKHLLTFVGIVAIADPVRKEVPSAIKECHEAGIAVKIVTGDTPGTARQIARQIGIWLDAEDNENKWSLLTGSEFEAYSDEELLPNLDTLKIIARARPLDKARLVRLYQQMNKVVAVTGDGTNDAPALNQAQVGLSMGDGTSVAKEASDITIIDNSFASISKSVMWGRSLYQNIQRFILFQMTINVAACLIVMAGAFLGTQSPITVPQMLWVNLIMDTFAAMALASLPPSQKVMQSLPRNPKDFIINSAMGFNIAIVGGIFFLLLLALLSIFNHMDITSVTQLFSEDCFREIGHVDHTQGGLSSYELSLFFTFFVFFQFWNLFNARTFFLKQSFFSCLKGTSGLLIIAVCILIGQILIVELGGEMFSVVPLTIEDWLWIVLLTFPVFLIGELFRAISRLFR